MKPFYPHGSLAVKALLRYAIMLTIGMNVFLDHVQDDLFQKAEYILELGDELSGPASQTARQLKEHFIPAYQQLEYSEYGVDLIEYLGLPEARAITNQLDKVIHFQKVQTGFAPLLQYAGQVIRITSSLFWIPIIISGIWLLIHFCKSKYHSTRIYLILGLVIAIYWNTYVFNHLIDIYQNFGAENLTELLDEYPHNSLENYKFY